MAANVDIEAVEGLGTEGLTGLRLRGRRQRPKGVVTDMLATLVRAILFGIGAEIGRDIYKKVKGEGAPPPQPLQPASPDPDVAAPAPDDDPPAGEPPA